MNIPRAGAFASLVVTLSTAAYCSQGRASTASSKSSHRVISYNVLSSHLASPSHFTHCKPEDLAIPTRLEKLKAKLTNEIKQGSIISLQEVSHTWAGPMHALFQRSGYYMITALHGPKFSDYMGVGIAFPNTYECVDVSIKRLADTTSDWPKQERKTTNPVVAWLLSPYYYIFPPPPPPFNPWEAAASRQNQLVMVKLRERSSNDTFWVANYHMPCLFGTPAKRSTMHAHASLLTQYVHTVAKGDPYVITGDFNLQPNSSTYKLLTQATLSTEEEDYPVHPAGPVVSARFASCPPLKSAYVTANGAEPEFTNNARTDGPQFIECLDYIFTSGDNWTVNHVINLPPKSAAPHPYPDAIEPSDHILIGASLSLKK